MGVVGLGLRGAAQGWVVDTVASGRSGDKAKLFARVTVYRFEGAYLIAFSEWLLTPRAVS